MYRKNKKGEEIVEASVVLPLIILTVISMITISVFLLRFEISQSKAHIELSYEVSGSNLIFGIKKKTPSRSGRSRGVFSRILNKEKTFRMYVISQDDAVMLGELAE